jgi:phospholipid-binding lipoprotein MlaA
MKPRKHHISDRFLVRRTILGVASAFLIASGVAFADTNNGMVTVTNGIVSPVKDVSDAATKNNGKTLFLSSAIPIKKPTPKPSPTPHVTVTKSTQAKSTSSKAVPTSAKTNASSDDPGDDYGTVKTISDPIQPLNRGTFWVNHQIYHYVFHPLNKVYKTVLPTPVRTGVSNVFDNVNYPVRFVNDLLQWQPQRAGLETEKFLVNTTAGVGGIFKVSKKIPSLANIPKTDTTATLAKWRIPEGPYIVWPILGPKSARDTVGFVGDVALNPVTWLTFGAGAGLSGGAAVAVQAPSTTSSTSDKLDNYETVTDHAVDRYEAVRSAYGQNRQKVESQ